MIRACGPRLPDHRQQETGWRKARRRVICAKVARCAERVHLPEPLPHSMRRVGPKGDGRFGHTTWRATEPR